MDSNNTLSYRFDFHKDTEKWLEHLKEKGFVVVGGLISESDCQKAVKDMKECLSTLSPKLKTEDEEAWTKEENYPFMLHGGMVQYVGHSKFQWELREKVAPIFAKIWNCKETELATSFDGFCFMNGKRGYQPKHPVQTAHTDQSPLRDYLWSVQGLVSLCDSDEDDGGLVVIPNSHKFHKAFLNQINKGDVQDDWYKFSEKDKEDPLFKTYVKVCGKTGDFMMWDSRVFHCNTVPTTPNIRACVYICQIPKEKVPEKARQERAIAWNEKRCSSHHPGDGFDLFPILPGKADPALKDEVPKVSVNVDDLNDLQ